MPDQRVRSLTSLALLQAILGAMVAVVVFALNGTAPTLIGNTSLAIAAAIIGAATAVFFATLHQVLKHKHLALSALIMSVLSVINAILVITSTGGLDSPYYSIWILIIVGAGIFGATETIVILGITVAYYVTAMVIQGFHGPYMQDHLVQFAITVAAAGLAEWVHSRNRNANMASTRLETLTGQLTTEQLKADAIMSSIGEGVMVIDGMRRIKLFNKAAQDLTGWDESSAQGIDFNLVLQLKTADDQPIVELNDPFAEAWKKQTEVVKDTLAMTTRSGRKIQVNLSISPIFDANKQPSGAIALFRDISEAKQVERQKEEFVSTASHEMRTPVAAIEGYISLAMNENVASIDDRARKYLEKAHDTIQHLGELFRDLLSVTKAEEGQLGGRIDAIDIGKLAQSAVDDMQFTIKKKNLTLVYQIGDQGGKAIAPLFYVAANHERLREVIMNLIDNAGKFTTEGGIKVVLEGDDKEVTVSVSDSGVGIAQEDIGHLFQKFYRIDSSATRTIGGTGLGLYLCRRLIEAFNGRIWVESKIGQGSSFKFSLPRLTDAEVTRLMNQTVSPTALSTSPQAQTSAPAVAPAPAPVPAPAQAPSSVVVPTNKLAAIAMPVPEVTSYEPAAVDSTASVTPSPIAAARVTMSGTNRRIR